MLIIYIQMYVSIEAYLYMIYHYQLLLFDTMVLLKIDTAETIKKAKQTKHFYTIQAKTQNI